MTDKTPRGDYPNAAEWSKAIKRRAPDTQVAPSPPPRMCPACLLVMCNCPPVTHAVQSTIGLEWKPSQVAPDSLVADIERRNLTDEPPCSCGGVDTPYGHGHTGNCSVMVIHDLRIYLKRAKSRLERVTQAADAMRARYLPESDHPIAIAYDAIRAEKD